VAITIKGIRVDFVSIERNESNGQESIKDARYSLISSTDHVLATQSIGGYGGLALKASPQTVKALENFMQLYKADVLAVLGLDLT
jgi:hypothetical protein